MTCWESGLFNEPATQVLMEDAGERLMVAELHYLNIIWVNMFRVKMIWRRVALDVECSVKLLRECNHASSFRDPACFEDPVCFQDTAH